MKLLIAGAGTPTGRELVALLKRQDITYSTISDRLLNARDEEGLQKLVLKHSPDQLINLLGFDDNSQLAVFKAEHAVAQCTAVQAECAALLANLCQQTETPLIHLSTCYVFDGNKKLGYNEQDVTQPLGVYGKTALEGEKAVSKLEQHIIIRSGWRFGPRQCDVIDAWIKECKKNQGELSVTQRRLSPTPDEDLARAILAICFQVDCEANVWGTYHYCGLETKKESEFVRQVLKYASQHDEAVYQLLENIKIRESQPEIPEVSNITLSSKKLFDTFGIKQRSWHGSLQTTIKSLYYDLEQEKPDAVNPMSVELPEKLGSRRLH